MRAIILAGGDSSRLNGRCKGLIRLGAHSIIEIIVSALKPFFGHHIAIVTSNHEAYAELLNISLYTDIVFQKGPLGGILSGLVQSDEALNFFIGCDMPFVSLPLIDYMSHYTDEYDVVIPQVGHHLEPLYAFYNRSCIQKIAEQLALGNRQVRAFYEHVKVKYISKTEIKEYDPHYNAFFNVNTEEDLERARALFKKRANRQVIMYPVDCFAKK